MGISKISVSLTCAALALGFAGVAQADQSNFVKTVSTVTQCEAQEGYVMDLNGVKHCLVPVISKDFQAVEYAGDLRGVTSCPEKDTRKSQNGDFCLVALEAKPIAKPAAKVTPADSLVDTLKDEAKKEGKKRVRKKLFGN